MWTGGGQAAAGPSIRWTVAVDRGASAGRSVRPSPEGLNSANGGDRINAHAPGRFLRAFPCRTRRYHPASWSPCSSSAWGCSRSAGECSSCARSVPATGSGVCWPARRASRSRRPSSWRRRRRPADDRATSGSTAASTAPTTSRTSTTARSCYRRRRLEARRGRRWSVVERGRPGRPVRGPGRTGRTRDRRRAARRRARRPAARVGRDGGRGAGSGAGGYAARHAAPLSGRAGLGRRARLRARGPGPPAGRLDRARRRARPTADPVDARADRGHAAAGRRTVVPGRSLRSGCSPAVSG